MCVLSRSSPVWLLATSWTVARQAPLLWDSPGKNAGVAFHFLVQGNLLEPGIKPKSPMSPASAGGFLPVSTTWEAQSVSSVAQLWLTPCDHVGSLKSMKLCLKKKKQVNFMVCNLYLYSPVLKIIMEVGFLHPSLSAIQETWVRSLVGEDALEEGMATHSSILAWRIPWKEEPVGLQSVGLQKGWTHLSN